MIINKRQLTWFIKHGIAEDVRDGDHTSNACINKNQESQGHLLIKDTGVLAGVDIARAIFTYLDKSVVFEKVIDDGKDVKPGDIAFNLRCNSRALLMGERLALNTMQRLSGIATISRLYAREVKDLPVTILDTRKTTPLLRFLEKYAVHIGGCANYRTGLYDRIMIKDNHIKAAGSITAAIELTQEYLQIQNKSMDMTVEVRTFEELIELLSLDVKTRIMLDNMSITDMAKAVAMIDKKQEVEASGGVTLKKLRAIALTGVDYISVGALTHSAGSLDMSLKII